MDPDRARLRAHFDQGNTPAQWDVIWAQQFLPWDRGVANPSLEDLLAARKDPSGIPLFASSPTTKSNSNSNSGGNKKLRALIPGCGKGYDVLLLAAAGYDAVGLDGSPTAIQLARELAEKEADAYPAVGAEAVDKGTVKFVEGDFFKDDWIKEVIGKDSNNGYEHVFDVIFDYTFMVALPINTRKAWALQMSKLLSPTGRLICCEFPLYRDPLLGGPPYAVRKETYEHHLARPGEDLEYKDGLVVPLSDLTPNAHGFTCVSRWMPERAHEPGQGTDHISVWAHAN